MKNFFTSAPIAMVTFVAGLVAAAVTGYFAFQPVVREVPTEETTKKKFEVFLEQIEVRDADPRRWNSNGGYLDMFDAVFFDDQTLLTLYLQDGMRMSHDGGKTWQRMFEPSGTPAATGGFTLWDLDFVDDRHGWAGGNRLIKTSDGAKTWVAVDLPEWIDNLQIKFLNEKLGYVAGRGGYCERGTRCNTWLSVYKTTDGGLTWKRTFKTKKGDTPWQVVAINEEVAMVTFGGGWLYRTSDAGRTWQPVMNGYPGRVASISRAPTGKLWMFGTCSVLVSDDLGATWKKPEGLPHDVTHHEWWSVDFSENGTGIAVSEDAAIAITRDSGNSWKLAVSNLHKNGAITVPDNPFSEALRRVQLKGNRGIVGGSQRDYWITILGAQ